MRLNHANLPVADVATLRAFLVRHFGFTSRTPRDGDAFAVLEGEGGFILTLMRHAPVPGAGYPPNFHIGFELDSPEAVHAKHAELIAADVDAGEIEELRRSGFSSLTFYCHAPSGILVEVSTPLTE